MYGGRKEEKKKDIKRVFFYFAGFVQKITQQ